MALDRLSQETVRTALANPNRGLGDGQEAAELLFRLARILDAVDAVTASSVTTEDLAKALQTE